MAAGTELCSTISATKISNTPSVIASWHLTGSATFGGDHHLGNSAASCSTGNRNSACCLLGQQPD